MPSPSSSTGPSRRLDSWKEIAEYLGRDVRTAIRWEKERALPVHRVPGGKRQAVFAYSVEIDSWLNGQPAEDLDRFAVPTASAQETAGEEPLLTDPASPPPVSNIASSPDLRRRVRSARLAVAVLALVVVIVAAMRIFQVQVDRQAERISFGSDKLVAWNQKGQVAWEYAFSDPLYDRYPMESSRLTRFVDLRGDGQREILAVVGFGPETGSSRTPRGVLFCFSTEGKLLWKYEPKVTLRFGGRDYEGPWLVRDMLVSPEPKNKSIWVAFAHNLWWPAFVTKIDPMGGASVQFVNSGHIFVLDYMRNSTGAFVLAGGIDNESRSAILAVIPEGLPFCTAPHDGDSPYRCESCKPSGPATYFLFPRSELADALEIPFHYVDGIQIHGNRILVETFEGQNKINGAPAIPAYYEFSADLQLQSISFSDVYWGLHKQLEKEGKIHHSAANCPDRLHPNHVKMWTPEMEWTQPPLLSSQAKN